MFKDLLANCKAQEGASDSDIQELIVHQPPSTRAGQCLNACVLENVGFVRIFEFIVVRKFGILI